MLQLEQHRSMDAIVQGTYWVGGRGCHLGCLTHSNNDSHASAERLFGIPLRIGFWLEAVFEGLPPEDCAQWVIESTAAIPVGADLSRCHHQLAYWLLGPDSPSSEGNAHPLVKGAVSRVRELHGRTMNGKNVTESEWTEARSAAYSAAYSARSAAYSAHSADRSAAHSACSAAYSAERSADSAARSAACSAAWKRIAEKSIEIFRNAPTTSCGDCSQCVVSAYEHVQMLETTHGLVGA